MARPIPVSNKKIQDWNLFLHAFNKAAEQELPKDASGNPRWELLDKNEAFGNYKGGQDFYKQKWESFSQGLTGTDRLTEADFPVMQKLFSETYAAAQAEPEYFNKYVKPNVFRYGADETSFNPTTTRKGNENTEGWIGSVSRNFFFPQDTHSGAGGSNPAQKDFVETIFPNSFNQGESFYKANTKGSGVRYFDKGGKMMCYDDGGRIEMEVEVEEGGDLEEVSEDHVVVNSDESTKDSVTLTTGDKVGDKEVINKKTKVVFGNLQDPVTGNLFKDDALKRAKEMADLEGHPMPWAKRRLDVLKRQEAEAYDRQQKLNGNNGGENHDDGGNLNPDGKVDVDPPVKKKLFYVPEDQTMYQVSEDKISKYADKLKNATEYTDVKPEGYSSDKVYLEKNGVLREFTRENADIILKQPEAQGSREVYPVIGQKKNTDVQKKGSQTAISNDWSDLNLPANNEATYSFSEEAEITGPLPDEMTAQSVQNLKDRNKKVEEYTKKFEDGYNAIIEPAIAKSRGDILGNITNPLDLFKQKHPEIEDEAEILEGARQARNNDNTLIASIIIPELKKKEEQFISASKLNEDAISKENVQNSEHFRNYLDNLKDGYQGIKLKRSDGTLLDTDTITDSQWTEIRNQVIQTYQVKTIWDEKTKQVQEATKVAVASEDPQDPLANFIKTQGIDKGLIPLSDEQWKPYFETMEKVGEKYVPIMTNLRTTIEKDNLAFKLGYQNEVNQFSQVIQPKATTLRDDLQKQIQEGLPEKEAQKIWEDFQEGIQKEETAIFEKWNKLQNENSQKKLKIVEDSINAEVKDALKGTLFEKMDLSKVDQQYVKDSINAFFDLTSSFTNNELARGERFIKDNNLKIYNGNDYAQQFGVEMRRGVVQMIESTGGFVSFMGGYEVGNTVNDFSAQFSQNNPQYEMGHFEFSKLSNPDYWVALTGPMAGQQLVFLPLSVTGAGLGTQAATRIGLGTLGTATLRGIGGAIAVRPFNAMINSGAYYNELLANGTPTEEAAAMAADDFTYQLSIGIVDMIQIGAGFSPLGNIFKIGKFGSVGTKVIGGSVTEMLEEGAEGYHPGKYNSFQTVYDYATSPTGVDNLSGGAMGGLVMGGVTAVPDLAAQRTGNTKKFLENLCYDMLSGPEMGKRYEDLKFTIEGLKERGMLSPVEYQNATQTLDFAYSKGKEIPVDLTAPQRHQILTHLSDINRLNQLKAQTTDETLLKVYDGQIKEIEKSVGLVVAGKEPMYFIGNTPYSKEDFQALIENDEVLTNLTLQKTSIEAYNDPKMSEAIEARKEEFFKQQNPEYDSENKTGVQGDLREGQELVETQPDKGTGSEETGANRVLQKTEVEEFPESTLTDEEEKALSDKYDEEQKVVEEYYTSRNEPLPTAEEMDELNGLFTIEDGQMLDVDGDPTNINDVVKKYTELKEGTVFESSDGKIRYIREEGEIVRRNAKGERVEVQRYVSKKGKKTKVEAPKGTVFMDAKNIKKYDQERLDAGLEEGDIAETTEAEKIAETSNSPKQIKEAWEEEKVRLRDEVDTENTIYEAVKENGIRAEDWKQNGDQKLVKDGSVSAVGWFSSKALPIDVMAQQAGVEVQDIIDFVQKYGKGAHQYNTERTSTLKALEARYKKLTGVNIKSVPRETKKEAKLKVEPKKEPAKVSVTHTEKAKELADKIRSFKSKPKTIKFTDENGNEIEGIVHTKSFYDEILEIAALAVEASGRLADGVKAALVHVRKQDWYKKLTPEGQVTVDQQIKEMIEAEPEEKEPVKKTITTHRAYEGEFRDGVKKELEKLGLTREVESQPEAKKKAKEFIKTVGEEAALEAVMNNDVADAAGAYVWNELIERIEAQLATETDPEKIMELEKQEAQLIDEFGRKALSAGRFNSALNDIYQNSDLGYSVEKKIKEYKDQNNGEIPAEVEAKFRAIDKELKEVRKKLVEAEKRAKDAEAQLAIDNIKESIARSNTEKGKKEYAQKALNAIGKLRKGLRANMYSDALGIVAIVDIGLSTIETAIKGGMEISKAINKGVKYIKGRLKEQGIDEWEKEEKFRKDVLEAFQQEGINVGETTDGKLKIPNSVIRDFVERGIDNIEDLVKAIQNEIKDTYPDATEREIRDAITGYGKTVNLNSDEIATQIRKMKRIGRIISSMEDVANKKRPLKSGIQRDKLDAQERALNKELRELMKDLPMDEELQADQLKTATDALKQRVRNQIEDLQREIDKGEQVKKTARTIQEDQELADLRKQRDDLRKEHEAIFKDEEFKEKQRLENIKKGTQRRIKELETKIKEGDFSKRKAKPVVADNELTELRAEKLRLQGEYDKEFYKNKLLNRTKAQKIKDSIWDAWGLTRLFSATGEFSFIGIQGLIQTIAHPFHAVEAFKNALRFFASESKIEKWLNSVKSQPFYPEMKQSKLALTEPNAEITAREELFYSDWANLIWNMLGSPLKLVSKDAYKKWTNLSPFKAFERAAAGYLDTLRVMRFLDGKEMLESQGVSFEENPEAYKQVADVINTFTGRASLGKAELIAPVLTKVFFSPRNWASVFKTATPYAFYHFGKMRAGAEGFKPSVAQKMAIADFSKFVGLTISFVALAAAYLNNDDDEETGVELDPRSSDFLKIKLGVKRVDPWGGRIQQVILLSRLISGSVKKESGDIVPLGTPFKAPTRKDLLIEMATNKLAPSASMLEKFLSTRINEEGERVTKFGQPYEFSEELKEKLTPIYWGTVNDLLKDDPTALDGLLVFYSFIGGGVNVYDTKEEKEAKNKKND